MWMLNLTFFSTYWFETSSPKIPTSESRRLPPKESHSTFILLSSAPSLMLINSFWVSFLSNFLFIGYDISIQPFINLRRCRALIFLSAFLSWYLCLCVDLIRLIVYHSFPSLCALRLLTLQCAFTNKFRSLRIDTEQSGIGNGDPWISSFHFSLILLHIEHIHTRPKFIRTHESSSEPLHKAKIVKFFLSPV